ncbi:hypothetical protein BCV70DRAFT_118996 [Testicularia cyperi]|uniref:Uncharacterized protein n=1 Tax=Testicularia cyperi TaxID=1882483 RepID=A0A317XM97_9BASI|nr:hypothetical protein BCV70DRAFT_118996 [Testicularia cyperi]
MLMRVLALAAGSCSRCEIVVPAGRGKGHAARHARERRGCNQHHSSDACIYRRRCTLPVFLFPKCAQKKKSKSAGHADHSRRSSGQLKGPNCRIFSHWSRACGFALQLYCVAVQYNGAVCWSGRQEKDSNLAVLWEWKRATPAAVCARAPASATSSVL